MKASDLLILVEAAIKAKLNVLVTGMPGIAKTALSFQAAFHVKAKTFIEHPSTGDPTNAGGFPMFENGKPEFIHFGTIRRLFEAIDAGELCVLILDDFGQGTLAVQSSYMPLLDKLKGKCAVIATTNRRSDKANVQGVLEPVKSRFHTIEELTPDLNDFCNHLLEDGTEKYGIDEDSILDIVSYLRFRPENLVKFDATLDLINSPCPRTWVNCGQLLTLRLPVHIEFIAVAGAIGEGCSGEFNAFKKMRRNLPNLDGILLDPMKAVIPTEPSVKWAVCTGLAVKANEKNFDRIHQFAKRLHADGQGQFAALMVRDAVHRTPAIMDTDEFHKLASGPIGDLIAGNFS